MLIFVGETRISFHIKHYKQKQMNLTLLKERFGGYCSQIGN